MPNIGGILQRACTCGQHTSGSGECEACKKKRQGMLQRSAANNSPMNKVPPIVHEVLNSPGQALDMQTRTFMEPRFGHDFSQVRVHTDAKAAASARAVNALAFTVGRDIVFGSGNYHPATLDGRHLISHELTHVVQQQSVGTGLSRQAETEEILDSTEEDLEEEADDIADAILEGEIATVQSRSKRPLVQRQSPRRRRRSRPTSISRGGTVFHPGVSHDHTPTGRWGDIQAASQRACDAYTGQLESEAERQASGIWDDIRGRRLPRIRPPSRGATRAAAGVGIECSCANLSPEATLEAARLVTMTARGLTLASQHLIHFMRGGGADFTENAEEIVRRDAGVRNKLIRAMNRRSRGHIRIRQGEYSVEDFQFAFGSIDRMDYEIDWGSSTVHIWFMDRYEWHPVGFGYSHFSDDGPGRLTNCVHAAGVEYKNEGGRDFWMVGDARMSLSLFPGVSRRRRRRP
jgi:hypothetical protein